MPILFFTFVFAASLLFELQSSRNKIRISSKLEAILSSPCVEYDNAAFTKGLVTVPNTWASSLSSQIDMVQWQSRKQGSIQQQKEKQKQSDARNSSQYGIQKKNLLHAMLSYFTKGCFHDSNLWSLNRTTIILSLP